MIKPQWVVVFFFGTPWCWQKLPVASRRVKVEIFHSTAHRWLLCKQERKLPRPQLKSNALQQKTASSANKYIQPSPTKFLSPRGRVDSKDWVIKWVICITVFCDTTSVIRQIPTMFASIFTTKGVTRRQHRLIQRSCRFWRTWISFDSRFLALDNLSKTYK